MKKSSPRKSIIVIGELNIDAILSGLDAAPKMGQEILASDFQITLGSASAIFSCGMARLGHEVMLVSKVGADYFGEFCLSALREAGVSTNRVTRDTTLKTGITISLSTARDRALITYLGAISAMTPEDVGRTLRMGHRHLHMTSYFLQKQLQPFFPKLFRDAREMGLSTSFDPNSDPSMFWDKSIYDVFEHTDLLFLNEAEALKLTSARNARSALKVLGQLVPWAVIKLGARGAIAIRDGEITSASGFKVESVDSTGAGDSFAAGFVSCYLRGGSVTNCLRTGNACGALSTQKLGGTAGQPGPQTLKTFLRNN